MKRIFLLLAVVGLVNGGGLLSKCKKEKKGHVDLIKLINECKTYARPLFLFLTPEEFVTVAMTNKKSWSKWEQIMRSILEGNGDAEVKNFQDVCIIHNEILQDVCQLTNLKIFITKVYAQGVPDVVRKSAETISPKVIDYGTQIVIFISPNSIVTPNFYSKDFALKILRNDVHWTFDFKPFGSQYIFSKNPHSRTNLYLSKRHELAYTVEFDDHYDDRQYFKYMTPNRVKNIAANTYQDWRSHYDEKLPGRSLRKGDTFVVFVKSTFWYNFVCDYKNGEVNIYRFRYPNSATVEVVGQSFKELKNLFQNGSVSKKEISKWQKKFKTVEY